MTVGVHEASVANGRLKPSANKKRFLGRAASSTLIWCVTALTMAGTIGIGAEANAATYWSDTDYGYLRVVVDSQQLRIEYHPAGDGAATKTPDDFVTVDLKTRKLVHFKAAGA